MGGGGQCQQFCTSTSPCHASLVLFCLCFPGFRVTFAFVMLSFGNLNLKSIYPLAQKILELPRPFTFLFRSWSVSNLDFPRSLARDWLVGHIPESSVASFACPGHVPSRRLPCGLDTAQWIFSTKVTQERIERAGAWRLVELKKRQQENLAFRYSEKAKPPRKGSGVSS